MDGFEKQLAQLELAVSRFLNARFGKYRTGINFLERFSEANRADDKRGTFRAVVIAIYAVVFLGGAIGWGLPYYYTSQLNAETKLIEPNIDKALENRLNEELKAAKANVAEYDGLIKKYADDARLYSSTHRLTAADFEKMANAAGTVVRYAEVTYSNANDTLTLDCKAAAPTEPIDFVRRLKKEYEGENVSFGYYGYTVDRKKEIEPVSFRVYCVFPKTTAEEEGEK